MSISKGDTVKWTWQPPRGISGVQFQVVQVSDATSQDPLLDGFSSGDPTARGSFQFQFNQAGTFYYWSGFVEDSAQITFRGVIVVQDSFDKELKVGVSLNGVEGKGVKLLKNLKFLKYVLLPIYIYINMHSTFIFSSNVYFSIYLQTKFIQLLHSN